MIELANALIANNHGRAYEKTPLEPGIERDTENSVEVRSFASAEDERVWLTEELAAMAPAERGDCVVLARTRRLLEEACDALEAAGVEAVLVVRKNDFTSAPFRWLTGMLRLAVGRGDRQQLRSVSRAFFQLEGVELPADDVTASASARGGDLLRAFIEEALSSPGARASYAPPARYGLGHPRRPHGS